MNIKSILRFVYLKCILSLNKSIKNKKCYVCGEKFLFFKKFKGGFQNLNSFLLKLNLIGSDLDNFECMYCGSHDRERHIYMFFDKLNFWEKITNARILHFAPEKNLQTKICDMKPGTYVKADFNPRHNDVLFVDATSICFADNVFDLVIANHILEHILDYEKAISEIFRVLCPGGVAILQTPYTELLVNNFEDAGIDTGELRDFFYGQDDHVRIFSKKKLTDCIKSAGFKFIKFDHKEFFNSNESFYYGVNERESLFMAIKQ